MSKLDTSFRDWINEHGPVKLSKLLKTTDSTIRHWRLANTLPRPWQMKRIKELTKGRISYEEIIEGSCSPLNRNGGQRK